MGVFLILVRNPGATATNIDYPVLFIKQAQDEYNLLPTQIKRYKNWEFAMNSTTSNIFRKIADHIDYYYWNPPPGYPSRWLNVLIFTISLFLWLVAWTPIKVKTAEVMPLSPDNGDEVYIIKRTGFGATSHGMQYSEWVRFKINDKKYWCICDSNFCPLYRKNIFPTEAKEHYK